jgi:non-specific serine/threonine protein kinase
VPLADLSEPALIPDAVLNALRLPRRESDGEAPLDPVVAALSQQPSLLVLDNMEHLVEGGGAEIVQTLLGALPTYHSGHLTPIAGSARRARVRGGTASHPQRNGRPGAVVAVRQRAPVRGPGAAGQARLPDHQPQRAGCSGVGGPLEGIPLAVELAAARAQVLTPSQMLARLGDRFELLVSRKRGAAARQRTLRAAVDWSYQLLDPDLQSFFCRLSVFRGGWTVEAAEAVCEEPLALDYLAQLRDSSLVLTNESEQGIRFRMLETLREFGAEQMVPQERAALAGRHLHYYVTYAEQTPTGPGDRMAVTLDHQEAEYDNFRAALDWQPSEEVRQTYEQQTVRLLNALSWLWQIRGYWSEGRRWCAQVLNASRNQPNREPKCFCWRQGWNTAWATTWPRVLSMRKAGPSSRPKTIAMG